jgi:hypothetical protein
MPNPTINNWKKIKISKLISIGYWENAGHKQHATGMLIYLFSQLLSMSKPKYSQGIDLKEVKIEQRFKNLRSSIGFLFVSIHHLNFFGQRGFPFSEF